MLKWRSTQYFWHMIINLNKGKTDVMLFGSAQWLKTHSKLLQVVYHGHTINFVTEYKYLETVIDCHLILNDNFDKACKKASSHIRLLHWLWSYPTIEAPRTVYAMMIIPSLTYSMTHRIPYTYTQYNKLESLSRRVSSIIKCNDNLPWINGLVNCGICLLVKNCLLKELNSKTFDNYFILQKHDKNTCNRNYSIRLPWVKLELARQTFYF